MLNLLHKKCKRGGTYVIRGQMPKNANVICEGSLTHKKWKQNSSNFTTVLLLFFTSKSLESTLIFFLCVNGTIKLQKLSNNFSYKTNVRLPQF